MLIGLTAMERCSIDAISAGLILAVGQEICQSAKHNSPPIILFPAIQYIPFLIGGYFDGTLHCGVSGC